MVQWPQSEMRSAIRSLIRHVRLAHRRLPPSSKRDDLLLAGSDKCCTVCFHSEHLLTRGKRLSAN